MTTTWVEFLKNHKDNEDYNKAAVEVTDLSKPRDKNQALTKLTEAQPLVVVSKSTVNGAAQYLLNYLKMGNSILKCEIKFVAMIRFRKRATTVSVDPSVLFKFLMVKKSSPMFKDLLQAESDEGFKNLKRKKKQEERDTTTRTPDPELVRTNSGHTRYDVGEVPIVSLESN